MKNLLFILIVSAVVVSPASSWVQAEIRSTGGEKIQGSATTDASITGEASVAKEFDKATPKLLESSVQGSADIRSGSVEAHTEGDPDRPVTSGKAPNPETTGIEHEDIGVTGEIQAEATNKADLIEKISAPESPLRAIYMKFGDIKGESTDSGSAKGNVEYEWKVEEGEKAGGDGDVIITGGGTAAANKPQEIVVVGSKVRGWDPKTKEEVIGAAPADASEVRNETDLAFLAARAAVEDERIEEVSFNFEKIVVKYGSQARLFGIFPLRPRIEASVDAESRIKVRFPWYRFLTSDSFKELREDLEAMSGDEEIRAAAEAQNSLQIQSRQFKLLSNILKTRHDVVMDSIRNLK